MIVLPILARKDSKGVSGPIPTEGIKIHVSVKGQAVKLDAGERS